MRLTLDASVRRAGEGRVLVGGSPLVLMRLTAAGAALVDAIEHGEEVDAGRGERAQALLDRFLDAGIAHPSPDAAGSFGPDDVTVVVPAWNAPVERLAAIAGACTWAHEVIVVDDASAQPIPSIDGARVIRRDVNAGPGAARQTGLDHVFTPLVAFVDVDVDLHDGWIEPLLGHFGDRRVSLVAPRVASAPTGPAGGILARFDEVRSPLDLGAQPARVRAGTRVGYVPAAVLVGRTDDLREAGGFDPALRFGEDVDLVWRLDERGRRVRYEPGVVVRHRPRQTLAAWLTQRYRYGTSAAPLAQRHPGALAPLRVSGWSVTAWGLTVTGFPVAGLGVGAVTTGLLARKLRDVPDGRRLALRLGGLGHLSAGRSIASCVTRAWWPAAAVAALASRRLRRAVVLAAVAPAAIDWVQQRPAIDPVRYVALRVLDDVAYGTGVVAGAIAERSAAAVTPDLTSWPNSGRRASRRAS